MTALSFKTLLLRTFILAAFVVPMTIGAQENTNNAPGAQNSSLNANQANYVPLTNIPGITDAKDPSGMFNAIFRYGIIIAAMLAVLRITWGGFKYLTTEAISGKGEAKEIIREALVGLGLVLISTLLLQLINPDILSLRLFP